MKNYKHKYHTTASHNRSSVTYLNKVANMNPHTLYRERNDKEVGVRKFNNQKQMNGENSQHKRNPTFFKSRDRKDITTRRQAIEMLGNRLGVKELDDWYSIDAKVVRKELSFIKNYYNGSLYTALKELYPHHHWNPLNFSRVPLGYWRDINSQRDALEKVGKQLGVKELDDWYSVNAAIVRNELSFIGDYYNDSLCTALQQLYPQHEWNPLKFAKVPRGYWRDINNQRDALEKLGIQLGVKTLDDWYAVNASAVRNELSFVGDYYNDCIPVALKELYPQHDWNPLKFAKVPKGYWSDINNQRNALERVGKQLGVKTLDDWYSVDVTTVRNELSFISYYDSLSGALKYLYPQHNWNSIKFLRVPRGFWQKPSTMRYFRALFSKWKKKHKIQKLSDWYQLPPEQVKLFQRASQGIFGTVTRMLQEWFPQTKWIDQMQGSTPELDLKLMLQLVSEDVKSHHKIGRHSVDLFIPECNVAIEYQGVQHYQQHWRGNFSSQRQRDEEKLEYFSQQETGVVLAPVNYKWNGTWSQLRSTLRAVHSTTNNNSNNDQ